MGDWLHLNSRGYDTLDGVPAAAAPPPGPGRDGGGLAVVHGHTGGGWCISYGDWDLKWSLARAPWYPCMW